MNEVGITSRLDGVADPPVRDISDTARWAAVYRARETARPDAVFRDPLALLAERKKVNPSRPWAVVVQLDRAAT